VFLGASGAICGAYDDVVLPAVGEQHDWELELACVLGPGGTIAGYTIANDLTRRDLVYRPDLQAIGTDWLRSKNAPTFLPVGPWIVPAAFVPDPAGNGTHHRRFLEPGDVMESEITGLGAQRNRCVAAS